MSSGPGRQNLALRDIGLAWHAKTRRQAYHRLLMDVHAEEVGKGGEDGECAAMEINRRQDLWAEFYLPGNAWHPCIRNSYNSCVGWTESFPGTWTFI
jgi:hypothetical protein